MSEEKEQGVFVGAFIPVSLKRALRARWPLVSARSLD
jgi:hypothetical protein